MWRKSLVPSASPSSSEPLPLDVLEAVEVVDAGRSLLVTMALDPTKARSDEVGAAIVEGVLEVRVGDALFAAPLPVGVDETRCHWWIEDGVLTAVIGKVEH